MLATAYLLTEPHCVSLCILCDIQHIYKRATNVTSLSTLCDKAECFMATVVPFTSIIRGLLYGFVHTTGVIPIWTCIMKWLNGELDT